MHIMFGNLHVIQNGGGASLVTNSCSTYFDPMG